MTDKCTEIENLFGLAGNTFYQTIKDVSPHQYHGLIAPYIINDYDTYQPRHVRILLPVSGDISCDPIRIVANYAGNKQLQKLIRNAMKEWECKTNLLRVCKEYVPIMFLNCRNREDLFLCQENDIYMYEGREDNGEFLFFTSYRSDLKYILCIKTNADKRCNSID